MKNHQIIATIAITAFSLALTISPGAHAHKTTISGPEDEFHNQCHEKTKQALKRLRGPSIEAALSDLKRWINATRKEECVVTGETLEAICGVMDYYMNALSNYGHELHGRNIMIIYTTIGCSMLIDAEEHYIFQ